MRGPQMSVNSLHEPPKTWLLLSKRTLLRMNDIASIDIFSFFFSFFDKCQLFYTLESQHSFVFKTMQCSTSQSIMKRSSVLRAFIKTQIAISEIFAEFIITRKLKRATNASHKHSTFSFSRSFSLFLRLLIFFQFAAIRAYVSETLMSDLCLCHVR